MDALPAAGLNRLSDEDLLDLCVSDKEEKPWKEFVRRFQPAIAHAVRETLQGWLEQSDTLVDDLVMDTFVRMIANDSQLLRAFDPAKHGTAAAYLTMIARNATDDNVKPRGPTDRPRVGYGDFGPYEFRTQDEIKRSKEEIAAVLQAAVPEKLSELDQAIFRLYYFEGFTHAEIASRDSISHDAQQIAQSLRRTTDYLRERLFPSRQWGVAG